MSNLESSPIKGSWGALAKLTQVFLFSRILKTKMAKILALKK